jgi:UTP--glucose-1-phosphate uridylyltransferase
MKVTKAVIPAAGLGTRFLPYTKVIPKELVPILGVPSIQLIVQEGLDSSVTDFVIIANDDKPELRAHFSHQPHLENILIERGKINLLDSINAIIDVATIEYVPQPEPLGLGHAILMAKNAIGDHYFGILLPDDPMFCDVPALQQMIQCAEKYNASVIGVQEVPQNKLSSYGIVATTEQLEDGVFDINGLVEKPAPEKAPSNLAIAGRYVLSPRVFDSLETIKPGAGGEYQLTDAIADMMNKGERVIACIIKGTRYDVGNPLSWLQANIDQALRTPLYADAIREFCKKRL